MKSKRVSDLEAKQEVTSADPYDEIIGKTYSGEVQDRVSVLYMMSNMLHVFRGDRAREARMVAALETLRNDTDYRVKVELTMQLKNLAFYFGKMATKDVFYRSVLENILLRSLVDLLKDGNKSGQEVKRSDSV